MSDSQDRLQASYLVRSGAHAGAPLTQPRLRLRSAAQDRMKKITRSLQ